MSDVKADLMLQLNSPSGYTSDVTCKVSSEQWGAINAIVEGAKTQRENQLCDKVFDLRTMLENIIADAGACEDGLYSVSMPLIDEAAQYLRENP